ncbi:KH domain-containing protein [Candidatus Dojkabacteria bacterium]|uniref:RNA-binding protein KhpA n=1 Tax=Candidatus Dojkabacteria bacterium TaxID=2099670 RepID=A0A847VE44_9BACT|nr:KH domain-containing protein [Candidatus Dojkabacteria bacterium]
MKELLENIVKAIVNHPEDVSIEEKESVDFPGLTILTIDVNESDKGIIIGRKGRTINSIRDIVTISAIRNDKRVRVILKDDNREGFDNKEQDIDMLSDEI